MASSPAVPSELKPISPYLARATELATADPVISYWCTYYALQQAMTLGSKDPESQVFLFALMDKLEAMKAEHEDNDAVTEDHAASAYVENFGLKIFAQADNEDRKGRATRLTAKKFLAAANFLELLSVFGEVGSENRDKIKYSKWKATDIAKAFREGRAPVPGPAGGLREGEEAAGTRHLTAEEAKELSKELAALGTDDERKERVEMGGLTPAESKRGASTSLSTEDDEAASHDEAASYPFPRQPTELPSVPPSAPDFIDEGPSRSVTPSFPSFLDTPQTSSHTLSGQSYIPTSPAHVESHQTSNLAPPAAHLSSEPPAFPSAVFPSAPSLPPQPPQPPAGHGHSVVPPPPPAAPVETQQDNFDPAEVAKMQKHARWAISALNYEDYETARKELRLALAMLGG
ncbi:hypothetical protein JCM1840_003328 [Sporobolomyces johnsonii]